MSYYARQRKADVNQPSTERNDDLFLHIVTRNETMNIGSPIQNLCA